MKNSKLSQRLRLLSPREFRQYGLLVHSPFYTQHPETIALFDLLAPHYPHFQLSEAILAQQMNPQSPPDAARMRVLRTYLLDLLDQYLIQSALQADKAQSAMYLARAWTGRGMLEEAETLLRTQLDVQRKLSAVNLEAARQLFSLQSELVDLQLQRQNRSPDLGLDLLLESLDIVYLANRLKYLCTYVSLGFHLTVDLPDHTIRQTLAASSQPSVAHKPMISIYRHLLQLLLRGTHEESYPQLATLLSIHGHLLNHEELVNIYGFLQNHLNQRYQGGQGIALRELFSLYQQMLELGLVFGKGAYSAHLFRNIAVVGARVGEADWTRQFIENHHLQLDPDQRDTLAHYCLGYLCFTEGMYPEALRHLQSVDFIDPSYRTGYQVLLLRIYFERGEEEAFHGLSQTFRRFLNRNRSIADPHRAASLNFLSISRKLMKYKMSPQKSPKILAALREELEGHAYLTDKTWLLAKLTELSLARTKGPAGP